MNQHTHYLGSVEDESQKIADPPVDEVEGDDTDLESDDDSDDDDDDDEDDDESDDEDDD